MNNPFSLENKTILVTGASSGIGRAIALVCSEMGASVVLTGRNGESLKETFFSFDNCDGHKMIVADLTNTKQRQELVEQMPRLDGIVHCAGIGSRVPCKGLEQGDIDVVMRPNFEAPVLLQSELLMQKKVNKMASIVFIASCASTMPSVGNAVYSASKGAIVSYAKCLALELSPRNIRVNCISPTMVMTNLALVGATQEQLDENQKKYPLGRYGNPVDIAHGVVYLLSNASSWVTGLEMVIDGGRKLK